VREIKEIIIHCADTPAAMDIGLQEIRDWHVRGNGWSDVGYHYIIRRNGFIETGRDESRAGAHVKGRNANSIGICLVGGRGGPNYTRHQWRSLESLVTTLKGRYPQADVRGHNELAARSCPGFDAQTWWVAP
jgi:N-acetylmuramoyl-L-alanine amidase